MGHERLLWGHPVTHWEWLVGLRQDEGATPSRSYFVLGIQAHGPSGVFGSLRLRYALGERVAPYVGAEWFRLVGDTGDLARQAGETAK